MSAETDRFLREVTALLPGAVYVIDLADLRPVFINPAAGAMLGYSDQELRTLGAEALRTALHPDDRERVAEHFERLKTQPDGCRRAIEYRMLHRDGSSHWFVSHDVPYRRDAAGEVCQVLGVATDITAYKLAETEREERAARLDLLARTSQQLVLDGGGSPGLLQAVFSDVAAALGFEVFFHFQVGEVPRTLTLAACGGISERQQAHFAKIGFGEFLCGQTAERQAPLVAEHLQESPYAEAASLCAVGMRCYVGVPLIAQHELLGTVSFATRQRDTLRDGELQVIQTVCDLAAVQLARARSERLLRDRDLHLRLAMDAAFTIAFEWDIPRDRVRRLQSVEQTLPRTGDAWDTLDGVAARVHPEDRALFKANVQAALDSPDGAYHSEYRIVRHGGVIRWLEENGRVEFDAAGRPRRLIGISHDRTERREAFDRLQEHQQRLAMALQAGQLGFWDWDVPSGRVVFGGRWADMLGYGPDEIEPHVRAWERLLHPDDVGRVMQVLGDHLAGRSEFYECEHRLRHKDGTYRWILDRGQVVSRGADGAPLRALGTHADITARRHAEDALQAKTQQLESLLTTAPLGVAFFDREHRYVQINQELAAINGIPVAEHLGRTVEEVLPVNARIVGPLVDRIFETGETVGNVDVTGETPREPGVQRHWLAGFYPVLDGRGAVALVGVWVAEITESKRAEQALRDADRQKDEFLAMLAHELRNPLAPIRTSVGILRTRGGTDPLVTRCGEVIDRQASQMSRLLDDLLDVSRLSRGRLTLMRAPVLLHDVIEAAVETSRPFIDQHRHRLELRGSASGMMLDGDAARLTQVFANLLNNAARYSHAGSAIVLTVHEEPGTAVVTVRDSGIGIGADMLERVFELFSQAREARDHAPGGLGIGLSLARRLVEMHGGTIAARSEGPGRGSEFAVRLPLVVHSAADAGAHGERGLREASLGWRVLVADDNVDAAESTSLLLEHMGCEVRTVFDGESALAAAHVFRPDVVLLDLGMPGLDGYEVCRRLRRESWGRGVAVIALSGWGQADDRERSAAAGFDRHLTKPADPETLVRTISETTRNGTRVR